jgi:hypothetical protein
VGNLARPTEAMIAWNGGIRLSNAEFADRFFRRAADDNAVRDVGLANSHAGLREATDRREGASLQALFYGAAYREILHR